MALAQAIRANSNVELFHARRGKRPYARIRFRERWQTHSLDSDIGTALVRHVVTVAGLSASPQTFNEALQLLRAWARFDAAARDVFLRVGRVGDPARGGAANRAGRHSLVRAQIARHPPQNFPGGTSPFAGDSDYPGTGLDHVNLLVDFLYHAGAKSTRSDLAKIVVSAR